MFPDPLGGPVILPDNVKTNKTQWQQTLLGRVELFNTLPTLQAMKILLRMENETENVYLENIRCLSKG